MKTYFQNPVIASICLHMAMVFGVLLLIFRPAWSPSPQIVDLEVIQFPKQAPASVQLQPKDLPKPAPPPAQAVFGLSRKAIVAAEGSEAAEIKQGNTMAKEPDNLTLKDSDPDSLPIPTDDYLVTSMPRLLKEVRIPYPDEARKANVEGPVVMDLLIDELGKVRKVELLKGPGFFLDEAALQAAYLFQFEPARMRDKNVAVKIRYTYRFILENR